MNSFEITHIAALTMVLHQQDLQLALKIAVL